MSFPQWFKRSTQRQKDLSAFVKKQFGFSPRNIEIYEQAFRHSSASKRIQGGIKNSNERLEFLGDAVLDTIVAEYLYIQYPNLPEGELTKMKAKVVNRKTLNRFGENLELGKHLQMRLGKQEVHQTIIGNAFEALVGAMYLDRGFERTAKVIKALLQENNIDESVHLITDFKSRLHEWCQKEKMSLTFEVVEENQQGKDNAYVIAVKVNDLVQGQGSAKSKKTAEQKAAKEAFHRLNLDDLD